MRDKHAGLSISKNLSQKKKGWPSNGTQSFYDANDLFARMPEFPRPDTTSSRGGWGKSCGKGNRRELQKQPIVKNSIELICQAIVNHLVLRNVMSANRCSSSISIDYTEYRQGTESPVDT